MNVNKAYTRRDKHKCPSKCLSCFTFINGKKCEGKETICPDCNRNFNGEQCFKNHKKNRSKDGKSDSACKAVRKCQKCERLITGKHVDDHKCGYKDCSNYGNYVDQAHRCYMKKLKLKGGNCIFNKDCPCRLNKSLKKKDWCYSCETFTEKYLFYDFECHQNTGTHEVNLAIVQDYNGNEYVYKNIEDFCKNMINDKFKGLIH